jgi:hypothetical protein
MESEEFKDESFEDSFEKINIQKIENEIDNFEYAMSKAEYLFSRMKFYCDYHGLDILNIPSHICIRNLANILN